MVVSHTPVPSAGNYSLLIADGTGVCDTTIDFTIAEPTALAVDSVTSTANPCFGDAVGTIEVVGTGGTPAYTYVWSANALGQTSATAVGLAADTYTVTVTDNNNCVATRELVMGEGTPITLTSGQIDETCAGDADGSAGVNVTGGNGPFSTPGARTHSAPTTTRYSTLRPIPTPSPFRTTTVVTR